MHEATEIKAARSVTDKLRLLLDDLESYNKYEEIEVVCDCPSCGESFYEMATFPKTLRHWIPIIRDLFLEYVEDDEMLREVKRQLESESESESEDVGANNHNARNEQGEKTDE